MKGALSVSEWVTQNRTETTGGMDWRHVERVIFIDSTHGCADKEGAIDVHIHKLPRELYYGVIL